MIKPDPNLPEWFIPPSPRHRWNQRALFPTSREKLLIENQISSDELARWQDSGWVPEIDLEARCDFDDREFLHIVAVRDLARSGLSDMQITAMLSGLPSNVGLSPLTSVFSFRFGWVQPRYRSMSTSELDKILSLWLVNAHQEDVEALVERLTERLDELRVGEAEQRRSDQEVDFDDEDDDVP